MFDYALVRFRKTSCRTALRWPVFALVATACAGSSVTQLSPVGGMLLPGSPEIARVQFQDTPVAYRFVVDRLANGDSVNRDAGSARTEFRSVSYRDKPSILVISTRSFGARQSIDSSLVQRDGLAPIWEISRQGQARKRYDYNGSQVRLEVTAPDSAATKKEATYPFPVFSFEELDELIRSVPLRAGYHAILPLYSEGDHALETDTVSVEGQDSAGIWNVRFADPVIISHYGIDGKTRTIVRQYVERHADRFKAHIVADR